MTFRDGRPRCPACPDERALTEHPQQRTRLVCEHCRGTLVPIAEVEDMISQLRGEPFVLPAGTPGERTCGRCTARLVRLSVFDIEVDRCDAHGIWFDGKELTTVLEAATGVDPKLIETGPPVTERTKLGVLLRRMLFGSRHTGPWNPRRPPDDT